MEGICTTTIDKKELIEREPASEIWLSWCLKNKGLLAVEIDPLYDRLILRGILVGMFLACTARREEQGARLPH